MTEKEGTNARAEFLPVEWRSSLKLDGDTVESITPTKIRGLRSALNASAMDILYYTSPLYRSEVRHIFIETKIQCEFNVSRQIIQYKINCYKDHKVSATTSSLVHMFCGVKRLLIGCYSTFPQITDGLQTELNRLYKLFCERHPYFEATGGKVSVLAHSLGKF